jgi:CheY-like chemotaxis protein
MRRRDELVAGLAAYSVRVVSTAAEAVASLARAPVDCIIANDELTDGTGIELLERCATLAPGAKRIVLAAYKDLARVVRARTDRTAHRALQVGTKPINVAKVVAEVLGDLDGHSAPPKSLTASPTGVRGTELLLVSTARKLVRFSGIVVRPLQQENCRIEFVLPASQLRHLHSELKRRWPPRIHPKTSRSHPVAELFGTLSDTQELYAREVDDEIATHVYLVVLPWQHEAKVTLALGIDSAELSPEWTQCLAQIHDLIVTELAELVVASDYPPAGESDRALLEYNYIVTDGYVGPDRRKQATTLLNRHVFRGRRARVPSRLATTVGTFVDRLGRAVWWWAGVFMLLSTIDTVFTYVYVRNGTVSELNPLLRTMVHSHPVLLVATKYALSTAAFMIAARFQLFRARHFILGAPLVVYGLLDAYWFWLLWARLGPR